MGRVHVQNSFLDELKKIKLKTQEKSTGNSPNLQAVVHPKVLLSLAMGFHIRAGLFSISRALGAADVGNAKEF